MDTTWKLWQALNHAPHASILFQRLIQKTRSQQSSRALGHFWRAAIITPFLLSLVALYLPLGLSRSLFFITLTAPMLLVAVVALFGTFYGMLLTIRVSNVITRERQRGAYDLLSLSPHGEARVAWMLCLTCLHSNRELEHVADRRSLLILITTSVLILASFFIAGQQFSQREEQVFVVLLFTVSYVVATLSIFYLDFIQSLALASLIGIVIPSYTRDRLDARLWSGAFFLLLQINSYLIILVLNLFLLPLPYHHFQVNGWLADFTRVLLSLGVFYAIRESLLYILWRLMSRRLATPIPDLERTLRAVI